MTFRIAVVQPITNPIGEDEKNVADRVGDRLHDGDAEGHERNSSIKQRTLMANWFD